jgi:hypothetical protein
VRDGAKDNREVLAAFHQYKDLTIDFDEIKGQVKSENMRDWKAQYLFSCSSCLCVCALQRKRKLRNLPVRRRLLALRDTGCATPLVHFHRELPSSAFFFLLRLFTRAPPPSPRHSLFLSLSIHGTIPTVTFQH